MSGLFVVLEGSDGSGKATQLKLLAERLRAVGYETSVFDFPRYEEPSSHFVTSYLNGEYGSAASVNPYTASLFYALDRYAAADQIRQALSEGKIVLSNRYTGSNMAHQGSKFASEAEQRGFFMWADSLEFQLLGIPRPSLNIFLRLPAIVSQQLIGRKDARSYTSKSYDEHEADLGHLKRAVATYDLMCRLFPKDYLAIDCTKGGKLLGIAAISDLIWSALQSHLPAEGPQNAPRALRVDLRETDRAPKRVMESDQPSRPKTRTIDSASLLAAWVVQKNGYQVETSVLDNGRARGLAYHTPGLNSQLKRRYTKNMDQMMAVRRKILADLPDLSPGQLSGIANELTPMAALASLAIKARPNDLESLARRLGRSRLAEVGDLGKALGSGQGLRGRPTSTSNPSVIEEVSLHLYSQHSEPVTLGTYLPRTEFELLADLLFEDSSLSRQEITATLDNWEYAKKAKVLKTYLNRPKEHLQPALTNLSYSWDLVMDGYSLNYLIQRGGITVTNAQPPSPHYGYDVPDAVEEAGLGDRYSELYDQSLSLYSDLQAASYEPEAAYAVLVGHRGRWQATTNFEQLANLGALASSRQIPPKVRTVVGLMLNRVAEVHPLLGSVIGRKQMPQSSSGSITKPKPQIKPKTRVYTAGRSRRRSSRSKR